MNDIKLYRLFTYGPGRPIHSNNKAYRSGMWIVDVRAKSMKQAYWLLSHGKIYNPGVRNIGITHADNSNGPQDEKPWDGNIYPDLWEWHPLYKKIKATWPNTSEAVAESG